MRKTLLADESISIGRREGQREGEGERLFEIIILRYSEHSRSYLVKVNFHFSSASVSDCLFSRGLSITPADVYPRAGT